MTDGKHEQTRSRQVSYAEYRRRFGAPAIGDDGRVLAECMGAPSSNGDAPSPVESAVVDLERLAAALEQARDARKFEIEMYWKRAAYFWTFIAAAFVGYAAFFNAKPAHPFAAFMMSMIGTVFTLAWYRVNRGSKFWQENWENHVELLEDAITGPLYKTVAERPMGSNSLDERWIGPQAVSVSKVNGVVSLYVLAVWVELAIAAIAGLWSAELHHWTEQWSSGWMSVSRIGVIVGLLVPAATAGVLLFKETKSNRGRHLPVLTIRRVAPTDPVPPAADGHVPS